MTFTLSPGRHVGGVADGNRRVVPSSKRTVMRYSVAVFAFFSTWLPARPPPSAPSTVAKSRPRPLPTWWPRTPPRTAPPTAPTPDPCPSFLISRTDSITPHSLQIILTGAADGGGGGGTAASASCCGGPFLAVRGLSCLGGFGFARSAAGAPASGCPGACARGAGTDGVAPLWLPVEVGIQPSTAPIPTRLNSVTAIAATIISG